MIAHSDEAQSKFKQFWTPTTFNYVNVDLDHNSYIYTALNAVLRNLYSINIHGNSLTLKIYGAIKDYQKDDKVNDSAKKENKEQER